MLEKAESRTRDHNPRVWLVLRTLGHPDVRLYDGSWNEWGARPELPRER